MHQLVQNALQVISYGIGSRAIYPSSCKTVLIQPKSVTMVDVVRQWIWRMPMSVLFGSKYGAWHCHVTPTLSVTICLCVVVGFCDKHVSGCHSKQCCLLLSLEKLLYHQDTLCVPENWGHLVASSGGCPKFLRPRTSIILPPHSLPFLLRGVVMKT
jgi:hypothetical protein